VARSSATLLRLLIVFAAQPLDAGGGEIQAVVCRVRERALHLLRTQIAAAFGDDLRSPVTGQLARFALAAMTARSCPARLTAKPPSSSCARRSRPRWWRPAGPCWPEADQVAGDRAGRRIKPGARRDYGVAGDAGYGARG
jgi:hypothetical protein